MDIFNINELKDMLPQAVIIAVFLVIALVNTTILLMTELETHLEEKKGKQIKFFDHKKIWLNLFWSAVLTVVLCCCKYVEWKEYLFYLFVILGGSSFFYEAVLKKLGKSNEN